MKNIVCPFTLVLVSFLTSPQICMPFFISPPQSLLAVISPVTFSIFWSLFQSVPGRVFLVFLSFYLYGRNMMLNGSILRKHFGHYGKAIWVYGIQIVLTTDMMVRYLPWPLVYCFFLYLSPLETDKQEFYCLQMIYRIASRAYESFFKEKYLLGWGFEYSANAHLPQPKTG